MLAFKATLPVSFLQTMSAANLQLICAGTTSFVLWKGISAEEFRLLKMILISTAKAPWIK